MLNQFFSPSLHRSHRAYFHNLVKRKFKKNLEGASQGIGEDRRLYILSKGSFVSPYTQLNEDQKERVGQLFRWVKDTSMQYSRDEIAECILEGRMPDDLQELNDQQLNFIKAIEDIQTAIEAGDLSSVQSAFQEFPSLIETDLIDLKSGQTPLHVAAQFGQLPIIYFLVDQGIDVDIMNDDNKTPLEVAKIAEQCEAEGLLIQLGAFDIDGDNFPINSQQQIQDLGESKDQDQNYQNVSGAWGNDLI
eukprot:TRINITY_DN12951_c0_g1_i4.p3 TRINITY_DN12951_c0_g1~~TRINITY_DN12951_c0_g1_i4.p3  ORF type:complete len:247 (+),score=40.41 TRINITY_DN12951_c0_g1_i4:349-1089(+)